MKHLVRLKFLLVVLLSLLALAACGGGTSNGGGSTSGGTSGGGTSGGGTSGGGASQELTVGVGQGLTFDKQQISVKQGDQVKLTFDNNGNTGPHSLVIDEANVKIPEDAKKGIDPGQSGSASFTAPSAGSYQFYCAVPGHKEAGMVGTLEVTP